MKTLLRLSLIHILRVHMPAQEPVAPAAEPPRARVHTAEEAPVRPYTPARSASAGAARSAKPMPSAKPAAPRHAPEEPATGGYNDYDDLEYDPKPIRSKKHSGLKARCV